MHEIILMKLGELVLKGLNRRSFEDKLMANARRRLKPFGEFRVYTKQSTLYVEPKSETADVPGAFEAMKRLFGVVGLSLARACPKGKDAIVATMALCEAAAYYRTKGMTLWDAMIQLYEELGYYQDGIFSLTMKGPGG